MKKRTKFICIIFCFAIFASLCIDSINSIIRFSHFTYDISDLLTVDAIMTGASVSFLVFSYFNNSKHDKALNKTMWENGYIITSIVRDQDKSHPKRMRSVKSFFYLSPVYLITISVFATILELVASVFSLYFVPIICEIITTLITLVLIYRFDTLRRNKYINILERIRTDQMVDSVDKIDATIIQPEIKADLIANFKSQEIIDILKDDTVIKSNGDTKELLVKQQNEIGGTNE